jgi:hypothetical protein
LPRLFHCYWRGLILIARAQMQVNAAVLAAFLFDLANLDGANFGGAGHMGTSKKHCRKD